MNGFGHWLRNNWHVLSGIVIAFVILGHNYIVLRQDLNELKQMMTQDQLREWHQWRGKIDRADDEFRKRLDRLENSFYGNTQPR